MSEFADIVEGIKAEKQEAWEALDRRFRPIALAFLVRHYSDHLNEIDGLASDALLALIYRIQRGDIRNSEKLPAFFWTILRRKAVARFLTNKVRICSLNEEAYYYRAPGKDPQQLCIHVEDTNFIRSKVRALRPDHRDVLVRTYFLEQPREQIKAEMGLTETKFRLLKTRALNALSAAVIGIKGYKSPKTGLPYTRRELREMAARA